MPIGHQDWSEIKELPDIHDSSDLHELAVRLGSVVKHFRTGKVVRYCSFDDDDNSFLANTVGASSQVVKSITRVMTGKNSIALVVDNNTNDNAEIHFYDRVSAKQYIGLSFVAFFDTNKGDFRITQNYYSGGIGLTASIQYNANSDDLELFNSSGMFVNFANVNLQGTASHHYPTIIKMIIDVENRTYVKMLANGLEYNLSEYGLSVGGGAYDTLLRTRIQAYNFNAVGQTMFVDDVVITTDEPI